MIQNAALGTSNQNCRAFIRHLTAPIFKAFKTNAIKYSLKISDLLGRQLCTHTLKSHVRQGSSS
ncbi:hypothetical protein ATO67_03400 [Agrobacterium bohemicum]|uniref:Uncharacterized protein n=1 Tax=Agrobacterium bohemicum TaxID=2052828 RepID=A0A135P4E9_9HYPH|nr:hypothetical protein ATO67_03400 [Agrobacterium bohemicum]